MVLFKIRITDQGAGPAWQRQSGARTEIYSPVLFGLIEQDQEEEEIIYSSRHYRVKLTLRI